MELTRGYLLGGSVRYSQPRVGFRSGIEPVLLAAFVPARPGQRVLEAGSGAGAALLCLSRRVGGLEGAGIERDPALAVLAARNARENEFAGLSFVAGRVEDMPLSGTFHHAFANPPYHPDTGTQSPIAGREAAKCSDPDLLGDWAAALGGRLLSGGSLTWIVPAAILPACLAASSAAGCGSPAICPLWPHAGKAAKLVLVRTVRGGKGPCRVFPGLPLHQVGGGFTAEAEAILRQGAALAE